MMSVKCSIESTEDVFIKKYTKIKEFPIEIIREIQYLKYLSHKNIVKYISHEYVDGELIIAMENGGSNPMKMRHLTCKDVTRIVKDISLAICYLHDSDICHRDIKPENIVYKNGVAKLCDFNSAVDIKNYRSLDVGTLQYKAPELYAKLSGNISVDMWSFGCTIYELFKKERLFPSVTETSIVGKILGYVPNTNQAIVDVLMEKYRINPRSINKTDRYLYINLSSNNSSADVKQLKKTLKYSNLLKRMLVLDPDTRISAREVCAELRLETYRPSVQEYRIIGHSEILPLRFKMFDKFMKMGVSDDIFYLAVAYMDALCEEGALTKKRAEACYNLACKYMGWNPQKNLMEEEIYVMDVVGNMRFLTLFDVFGNEKLELLREKKVLEGLSQDEIGSIQAV
jgi:serine/threonine protein kinase